MRAGHEREAGMSVIPLVRQNTIVETEAAFNHAGGDDGHAIWVQNLDPLQLLAAASNVSYDLRVGAEYKDHREVGRKNLPTGSEISLLPGAAVIIETEEKVRLPRSMFGYIVPKVSLLQKGLSNTISKVDPGYDGHLLVTVFNLGKEIVPVKRFDRFCALTVLHVLDGANLYGGSAKKIEGDAKHNIWRKMRDLLDVYHAFVDIGLIIATLLLTIAHFMSYFSKR
jgi:deoxycytidine triphosphate deaminase